MDIHHLRVFVTVFRNRSFSRASEELHLTQPTVSDHVKALEEELHCRLFDRLGRSIVPTKEQMSFTAMQRSSSKKQMLSRNS